jgi:ribosomal protein S27AE
VIVSYRLDGYCGLYCGACPILLGTKAGAEPRPCKGCKSEFIAAERHCTSCKIKACAQERGYDFCFECPDLDTCEHLHAFIAEPQWPYHQGVMQNMEMIKRAGLSKWLETQEDRWRCGKCGAAHSWWDETCPQCGELVDSYQADSGT